MNEVFKGLGFACIVNAIFVAQWVILLIRKKYDRHPLPLVQFSAIFFAISKVHRFVVFGISTTVFTLLIGYLAFKALERVSVAKQKKVA